MRVMHDAITDVAGIEVGHATDAEALTGCTAVLCRDGRDRRRRRPRPRAGHARDRPAAGPGTLVQRAHAVVLCGGSAFGLEAASGVVRHLADEGVGFDAVVARVPIVPRAVIFDLGVGAPAWPDVEDGPRAAAAASAAPPEQGCVGAGTGATVGKVLGHGSATKGGIGTASVRAGGATVGALVVVNAGGDVVDPATGAIVAGARHPDDGRVRRQRRRSCARARDPAPPAQQTTLAVVATDAPLTVEQANHLASVAHDGLARAIRPAHTMFDGDTVFALATGDRPRAAARGGSRGSRCSRSRRSSAPR